MTTRTIDGYPATKQLDFETAEAENLEDIDGCCVPFGYLSDQWKALVAQRQPGDELWLSSWGVDENGLSGAEVILLVRDGKVVDGFTTALGIQ